MTPSPTRGMGARSTWRNGFRWSGERERDVAVADYGDAAALGRSDRGRGFHFGLHRLGEAPLAVRDLRGDRALREREVTVVAGGSEAVDRKIDRGRRELVDVRRHVIDDLAAHLDLHDAAALGHDHLA